MIYKEYEIVYRGRNGRVHHPAYPRVYRTDKDAICDAETYLREHSDKVASYHLVEYTVMREISGGT